MYNKSDIFFVTHYYNESSELLTFCLTEFRRFYPDSHLLLICDGKPSEAVLSIIESLSIELNFQLEVRDHLKAFVYGGLWTDRYFWFFMQSEKQLLCKFDLDAIWWRSINFNRYEHRYYMDVDWFGTINYSGNWIRGGCCFFTYACVCKVLESKLLEDSSLWQSDYYSRPYLSDSTNLEALQDRIMGTIAQDLELVRKDFNEVLILQNYLFDTDFYSKFAVTHAHKASHDDPLIQRWKALLNT